MKATDITIGDILLYGTSPRKVLDIDTTSEGAWIQLDSDGRSRVEWVLDEKLDPYIPSMNAIKKYLTQNLSLDFYEDYGSYGEGAYKRVDLVLEGEVISSTSIN